MYLRVSILVALAMVLGCEEEKVAPPVVAPSMATTAPASAPAAAPAAGDFRMQRASIDNPPPPPDRQPTIQIIKGRPPDVDAGPPDPSDFRSVRAHIDNSQVIYRSDPEPRIKPEQVLRGVKAEEATSKQK